MNNQSSDNYSKLLESHIVGFDFFKRAFIKPEQGFDEVSDLKTFFKIFPDLENDLSFRNLLNMNLDETLSLKESMLELPLILKLGGRTKEEIKEEKEHKEKIRHNIELLKSLKDENLKYIQYLESLQNQIKLQSDLKSKQDFPSKEENEEELSKIILEDYISDYISYENEFKKLGYIDERGQWIKAKNDLIAFILTLYDFHYFKPKYYPEIIDKNQDKVKRKKLLQLRKVFEKRFYPIDLSQEFKPSRRKYIKYSNHYLFINDKR